MTAWKNAITFFHYVLRSGHPNPFDSSAVPALAGYLFSRKCTKNFLVFAATFKEVFYADMLPM